jgi:sugar phosphate isomerase/epimerase
MKPGIFESVFPRSAIEESFQAVSSAGFTSVQFDFASAGFDPWVDAIPDEAVHRIRNAAEQASVRIPAVSGTYNMAHPDPVIRADGLRGFEQVCARAGALGATFVTLCTGTRNESSMWRVHPENGTITAWNDMFESVSHALRAAEEHNLTLVVEPEPANVVSSATRARELLDQAGSDRLRIVLDPANIVLSDRSRSPLDVLTESFELLGPDIVLAHAKDLSQAGEFCAAGTGIVPWGDYWNLLEGNGFDGDVIFHTLTEADVPRAISLIP